MDLALRAIVLFFVVFILTRVIGRRELSSLEPFDLILLIILGDAIQQGLTQDFRSRRLRPILQGEPIVLVQDGSLIESNLRRERLTAGEVAEAARQEQIASIADVQWAVLETSGKISFIPKSSS
jgi:uncharacterized membrane protein YcaP (DUF421 family)